MMATGRRRLSPEQRAELHRMLLKIVYGQRPLRPMLVCENGEVVREVEVNVNPSDPNWRGGAKIEVRK